MGQAGPKQMVTVMQSKGNTEEQHRLMEEVRFQVSRKWSGEGDGEVFQAEETEGEEAWEHVSN